MNRYQYLNGMGEHVHQLDGRPLVGTSRVPAIMHKPGLPYWASGMAVQQFGCPNAKMLTKIKNGKATSQEKTDHFSSLRAAHSLIKSMTDDQYAQLIDKAYRAHAKELKRTGTAGTDLHAELEQFVKDRMSGQMIMGSMKVYPEQIQPFIDWTDGNVKRFLWSEGHCYSEEHWLGGISDAGYEKKDGTFGIIDFKSAKEAYFEHFAQIAGYDIQISENGVLDAEGNTIYTLEKPITEYAVFPFGGENPAPAFNVDIEGRRKTFLAMLYIYNQMPRE